MAVPGDPESKKAAFKLPEMDPFGKERPEKERDVKVSGLSRSIYIN